MIVGLVLNAVTPLMFKLKGTVSTTNSRAEAQLRERGIGRATPIDKRGGDGNHLGMSQLPARAPSKRPPPENSPQSSQEGRFTRKTSQNLSMLLKPCPGFSNDG